MIHSEAAIFFDVDGVLIDSVSAKGEVFIDLFAEYPQHRDAILDLHERNSGMTRGRKFELIHSEILGVPLAVDRAQELSAAFAERVVRRVIASPEIPGASAALAALSPLYPLHAISAVPQRELEGVLESRAILRFFLSVHGVPPDKYVTVQDLIARNGYFPGSCIFVGDSEHDFIAAQYNSVPFIHVRAKGVASLPGTTRTVPDLIGLDSVISDLWREVRA